MTATKKKTKQTKVVQVEEYSHKLSLILTHDRELGTAVKRLIDAFVLQVERKQSQKGGAR